MRTLIVKADASGACRSTAGGFGFRILSALPSPADPGFNVNERPGRLPVTVRLDGSSEPMTCFGEGHYFPARFKYLDITGAESGDVYLVQIFEDPRELVMPNARSGRQAFILQAVGTSAPAADPALATDGFPLRPGQRRITTYFGGVLGSATLWVRRLDGVWFNTADDVDPSAGPRYDTREIAVPGDRAYWRAAGAGLTFALEVESEPT